MTKEERARVDWLDWLLLGTLSGVPFLLRRERELFVSAGVEDALDRVEGLVEAAVGVDIPDNLGELLGLVLERLTAGGGVGIAGELYEIVRSVLPGDKHFDLRRAAVRIFSRKIDAQSGLTGAQLLQRSWTKTIDAQLEAELRGMGIAEKLAVCQALVDGAVKELITVAAALHAYPALAAALIAAKEAVDVPAINTSRRGRTLGVEKVRRHLVNSSRAITGDDLQ